MMFNDAGLVALTQDDWGKQAPSIQRNLAMRILRTPHGVVREPEPEHIADWGKLGITPNGQVISLGDAMDDAVTALDKAGARGAAALGAGAGFVFSSNRVVGALIGGLLGYFGGKYAVNIARKAIEVARASGLAVPTAATTTTTKAG
jgi:hypothetical protein